METIWSYLQTTLFCLDSCDMKTRRTNRISLPVLYSFQVLYFCIKQRSDFSNGILGWKVYKQYKVLNTKSLMRGEEIP